MRQAIIQLLQRAKLDPISVENSVGPGTPDINYDGGKRGHGWLELKELKTWPKQENATVKIPCFTAQQRAWLLRRWLAGGNAWLLLKVANEWLLFTGKDAALYLAKPGMDQAKTRALAQIVTSKKEDILPILMRGQIYE